MALTVLVTIEMFNTFNALSENQSLLVVPPWSNKWVTVAVLVSLALHSIILYVPVLTEVFSTAPLGGREWLTVILLSFPVILIDEILKFKARRLSAAKSKTPQSCKFSRPINKIS
eukprot:984444_1